MSADGKRSQPGSTRQSGDKGAFDALVRKYQHKLVQARYAVMCAIRRSRDIAQEAFIKRVAPCRSFAVTVPFIPGCIARHQHAKNAVVFPRPQPHEYNIDRSTDATEESYDMQGRMKDSETPKGWC